MNLRELSVRISCPKFPAGVRNDYREIQVTVLTQDGKEFHQIATIDINDFESRFDVLFDEMKRSILRHIKQEKPTP